VVVKVSGLQSYQAIKKWIAQYPHQPLELPVLPHLFSPKTLPCVTRPCSMERKKPRWGLLRLLRAKRQRRAVAARREEELLPPPMETFEPPPLPCGGC